ncbi:hypothetical protein K438DRAFT_1932129 [Mycena galopus ATCC 62051]|nr:hypothetical protein K438DRAFT_1932129 [Mycena galopus ATCC 62051]
MPPDFEPTVISNQTSPPVASENPPSLSSSEERECGRGLKAASGGRGWVPPAPDPSAMILLSLGCSSEERPDHSAEVEQSAMNTAPSLSPETCELEDIRGGDTELDIVTNALLSTKGDVCRSNCDMLALVPLYLEECDPLNAGDHDADAHALDTFYFVHRRSARLAAKREPPSLPSPQVVTTSSVRPMGSTATAKRVSSAGTSRSNPVLPRKRPCPGSVTLPPAAKRYLGPDRQLLTRDLDWSQHRSVDLPAPQLNAVAVDHAPRRSKTRRSKPPPGQQLQRAMRNATVVGSGGFTLLNNVLHSASGFQGALPPPIVRREIDRLYRLEPDARALHPYIRHFFPVPYEIEPERATFFVDSTGKIFMYRTFRAAWLERRASEVHYAVELLSGPAVRRPGAAEENRLNTRGPHIPIIIGHQRQSAKRPDLTKWHKDNEMRVNAFLELDIMKCIIGWVTSVVTDAFPGVAQRFRADAEWHKERYGIKPLFGLFWNFCLNAYIPSAGQVRGHSYPHGDTKNQVSVCVLLVHVLEGFEGFNHTKRTWLVLWEAAVVVELPPWAMAIYPSALFYHFNIDIHDIEFVTTEGDVRPTPQNSRPIVAGDEEGRSSMVFFNQATMHHGPATGSDTLKLARAGGQSGKVDFGTDANAAFNQHVVFAPKTTGPHSRAGHTSL